MDNGVRSCEVVLSNSAHQDSNNRENNGLEFNYSQTVLCSVTTEVSNPDFQNSLHGAAELRQRTVNAGAGGAVADEMTPSAVEGEAKVESLVEASPVAKSNGNLVPKLQTTESLDWQRVMAEDPNYAFSVDKSLHSSTSWKRCLMGIHYGAQRPRAMRKNERGFTTLSSTYHGDVNW